MKEYQRKQLLERVQRDGATIGTRIPETITIRGEEIALRSFVIEVRGRETYPQSEQERVTTAKRNLRRARNQRQEQLENGTISYEVGEQLVEEIIGIDRALTALAALNPTNIEAEQQRQEVADKRRWLSFLRTALGQDETTTTTDLRQ